MRLSVASMAMLPLFSAALQLHGIRPLAPRASALAVRMEATSSQATRCAYITLSPEDPLRLAKVLKKAWMEGGVKRGLIGSVLIIDDVVKIAAQGPVVRLQSFADWIESSSMLVLNVSFVDSEECPTEAFSNKFALSDAEPWSGGVKGSFAGDLADTLKTLSLDLSYDRGEPTGTGDLAARPARAAACPLMQH